ncbi:TIGR00730 family Rossman fold protein [Aeromicrobium duanguangcaii]|uniref:LOG family protein n=1 Tax=Aeromicrobium duanguangcaii TaxID=2968086 RepID=UPI002016D9E1|nr:TIGR00730 family Rossman fold protein [Aeromicrobium duanguangcaii]
MSPSSERSVRAVCLFCGARDGARPEYVRAAQEFGAALARAGVNLVFGGGTIGIMGAASRAAKDAGGRAIGVIPKSLLEREGGRPGEPDLHVVDTMHERKALMHELSDAFVVLPGGLGTYEEFFEILTWRQLGIHDKPIVVVDVEGYYGPLRDIVAHGVTEGFVSDTDHDLCVIVDTVDEALAVLGIAR